MSLPSSIVKSGVDTFDRTGIRPQPQSSNLRLIKDFGMEPARAQLWQPRCLNGRLHAVLVPPQHRDYGNCTYILKYQGVTRCGEQLLCSPVLPLF